MDVGIRAIACLLRLGDLIGEHAASPQARSVSAWNRPVAVYAHIEGVGRDQEKPGMRRSRRPLAGLCLLVALGCTAALSARAAGQCQVFLDREAFETFHGCDPFLGRSDEDFDPPVSNLGNGDVAFLADPLRGGQANVDGEGLGFPEGLSLSFLWIQSNAADERAAGTAPGSGLAAVGPGFLDPGPPSPDSVAVGADAFSESTDLLFQTEDYMPAVGLELQVAFGGSVEVTVFGVEDEQILPRTVEAPEGQRAFFGVSCLEATFRRINIGGPGGELVDDIQVWTFQPITSCPWDCGDGDGVVGVLDFLVLLSQWGTAGGSCELACPPGVNVTDFLAMLARWGPCPGGE
jgi:hypothetical protein